VDNDNDEGGDEVNDDDHNNDGDHVNEGEDDREDDNEGDEGDGEECQKSGPNDARRVIWALGMFFFSYLFLF
jgi:hypothetical protein